ncbi:MAG TPA: metal ABC transporter permease, partial [Usitatibacter sp.]|nr:metal ABC transporter permease [Usitatibacter sp.]
MKAARQTDTRKVLLSLAARAWVFRWHVVLAVVFLVAAKLAAVAVPMMLKRIVDGMGHPQDYTTLPLMLLAGYALMRFASTLFTEMRDLAFARAA